MAYQPTLFLTLEIAERINNFLLPIETITKNFLSQPHLAESAKQTALHNLACFDKFRKAQQGIVDRIATVNNINNVNHDKLDKPMQSENAPLSFK